MKIGTDEWLKKLEENYDFPCKIAFNLIKESDDNVTIVSTIIKSKSQLNNIKYSQARASTWTSEGSAVLSVKELASPMEYLKESERLKRIWGFALRNKKE